MQSLERILLRQDPSSSIRFISGAQQDGSENMSKSLYIVVKDHNSEYVQEKLKGSNEAAGNTNFTVVNCCVTQAEVLDLVVEARDQLAANKFFMDLNDMSASGVVQEQPIIL